MCMEYNEQPVCPHCKHTQRDEDQKKLLQNRLRRIEGQVRGLQSMLDQDAYCNDILIQSAAVSAALSAFNRELLENHRDGRFQALFYLHCVLSFGIYLRP